MVIQFIKSKNIIFNGGGAHNVDLNLVGKSIKISISGANKIQLRGLSDVVGLSLAGASTYNAPDFKVNKYKITMCGAGTASITVFEELNTNISGTGKIKIYRRAKEY